MKNRPAQSFQDLIVWQEAHKFVLGAYEFTGTFPNKETFGLTSQFRRASVSIAANIAEGFRRLGKGEKVRFLNISQGSVEECRYFLILARDLKYGDRPDLQDQIERVSRLLQAYSAPIRTSLLAQRVTAVVACVPLLYS